MNLKLREKAVQLRVDKQMSYTEIRRKLGVPKSTLSGWLRDYPISEDRILELRRNGWKKGEASRERFRNTMRKRKEKLAQHAYKQEFQQLQDMGNNALYVAGLMLYAAEGAKKDLYKISLANTDPAIIMFFIAWLRTFFGIKKDDMKFQLHLYENMNIKKETAFWVKTLGISSRQLYKTQIRKLQKNSFTYRESYRHGTCSIYFSNRDKKMKLMAGIKAFFDLHVDKKKV